MLIILIAALTVLNIFFLPLSLFLKFTLVFLALSYTGYNLWSECKNPIIKLIYDQQGWRLMDERTTYQAELCGDSTLTGLISILRFKVENKKWKRSCVICWDSLEQGEYKKLLVAVRYLVK